MVAVIATMIATMTLALALTTFAPRPPTNAADLCQFWGDAPGVAEEGARLSEMRNRGCVVAAVTSTRVLWTRDRTSCGVQAFRLARLGTVGDALVRAMTRRGRCVRGDDGGWVAVERDR